MIFRKLIRRMSGARDDDVLEVRTAIADASSVVGAAKEQASAIQRQKKALKLEMMRQAMEEQLEDIQLAHDQRDGVEGGSL